MSASGLEEQAWDYLPEKPEDSANDHKNDSDGKESD